MIKRVLSLMLVLILTCSILAGCGSDLSNDEVENVGTEQSEDTIVLPKGTYVREVQDGFIKEIQNEDGTSNYKVVYGNEAFTGTQADLKLEFTSIQNIGSWNRGSSEPGIWRYIDDNIWLTVAVWCVGSIPSTDDGLLTIDNTSVDDIKNLTSGMLMHEDTVKYKKADNYSVATMRVDIEDAGLSGYIVVLDDVETSFRWIAQFLMLTESAELDMLEKTATSVTIGTDYDRALLEQEAKVSDIPYSVNDEMSNSENENINNESTETPEDDMNKPAEPGEGPEGSH